MSMKRFRYSWAFAILAMAVLFGTLPPGAAAQDGGIAGTILDLAGKPWADIPVQVVSDQGAKTDSKTDQNGKYEFHNLRTGVYQIVVQLPNQAFQGGPVKVSASQTASKDFNFKEIVEKANPDYANQVKKQEEEKQKFTGMKQHFELGVQTLEKARQAKADMMKLPADQRDAAKPNVTELNEKAVTEFEAAKAALPEKDNNRSIVLAKLAEAYDSAGRNDDAIATYKQAIEVKPSAEYYNNLGGILGRTGKIDEATAAFQKSAELDPPHAAQAWLNFGVVLSNASRYKEAVEPLKKATDLDPKNPKGWYLLASALVADPSIYKTTGGKIEVTPLPGTTEAYQKAIDLDPSGAWGQQAKQGLEQLQQMTGGIDTKVNQKKKKP
jgi:tetratricopeptide (TPR) repeat protein